MKPVPPELTREESLYLDGALDVDARRRFEAKLDADPERRVRLDTYKRAMDLWREDTARVATRFDPDALADRMLRREAPSRSTWSELREGRRYAAAAVLLIGVSVLGAAWIGPQPVRESLASTSTVMRLMEEEQIDLQADLEMLPLPVEHFRLAEPGTEGANQR